MLILLGIVMSLLGGVLIETPVIGYIHGENGIGSIIFGVICGLVFAAPGVVAVVFGIKKGFRDRWEAPMKQVLDALKPGFSEAKSGSPLDARLTDFREHYSEFLSKSGTEENEPVQNDVTQIFRNIIQLQKNRLRRLGLTCEIVLKRMAYTEKDGIRTARYSDGKYDITDVTEEVAAKTVYRKDGAEVYTKTDKETANYTVIRAKTVGEGTLICPNCGAEATREALLDGCDYCGTKFTVEDLDSKIAVFAFRPDEKLRYEKYRIRRNKIVFLVILAALLAVFLGFSAYAVVNAPNLLKEADGGILLTLLASFFSVIVASPVYVISFVIVYAGVIIPILIVLGVIVFFIYKKYGRKGRSAMMGREFEALMRKDDPNFSMANFYSGVQNKISSVIYAENKKQFEAFAPESLGGLQSAYRDVVGIDVDRMKVTSYSSGGEYFRAEVEIRLILTRYDGEKCTVEREKLHARLLKSIACRTQVVCAPAVTTCRGCGASLDLLEGKFCAYCGRELDMAEYDWVIR
ncbi:MAG: hypothetical protein MJ096_06715, partial [Clostridia bacterium]|nr:hypothetical protein [Clostridia bacterium]